MEARFFSAPLGALLVRPGPLAAVALLALNDHVLKGAGILPGWLTGKLSDGAGLFIFPMLLLVLADGTLHLAGRRRPLARAWAVGMAVATAVAFTLCKTVPFVNHLVAQVVGPMVLDPTDLLMLPFVGLSTWSLANARTRWQPGRVARLGALAATTLVCAATSRAPQHPYPLWKVTQPAAVQVGCSWIDVWISKSGKEGVGATVAFLAIAGEPTCRVEIRAATLHAGPRNIAASKVAAPLDLRAGEMQYVYLPFAFDNERLWNDSLDAPALRRGWLTLVVAIGGAPPIRLELELAQALQAHGSFGASEPVSVPGIPVPDGAAGATEVSGAAGAAGAP